MSSGSMNDSSQSHTALSDDVIPELAVHNRKTSLQYPNSLQDKGEYKIIDGNPFTSCNTKQAHVALSDVVATPNSSGITNFVGHGPLFGYTADANRYATERCPWAQRRYAYSLFTLRCTYNIVGCTWFMSRVAPYI
jgi:hypothetical protein